MPASVPEKLNHLCRSLGVSDWGFFPWGEDAPGGMWWWRRWTEPLPIAISTITAP